MGGAVTELGERDISVVIPYSDRLENLSLCLRGLAEQTFARDRFEVVIGSLDGSPELARLAAANRPDLNIVTVTAPGPWNASRARNLGLRQARGEIVVLIDADIIVPTDHLEKVWKEQAGATSDRIILSNVKGYDEWEEAAARHGQSFAHYRDSWLDGVDEDRLADDVRWAMDFNLPWALCWGGLLSLPARVLRENDLMFQEAYYGWGVEDIEWGFRALRSGLGIERSSATWGVHMPHARDANENHRAEARNFVNFLTEWPCLEVEVVCRFGDQQGNARYPTIRDQLLEYHANGLSLFSVREVGEGDARELFVGCVSQGGELTNRGSFPAAFDRSAKNGRSVKSDEMPLLGIRLPHEADAVGRAYVSEEIRQLAPTVQSLIEDEVKRVARTVVG